MKTDAIDFVVLWVDGKDPVHKEKRYRYQRHFELASVANEEQSVDPKRFVQHDELKYCLRSIKKYAPWYRKIFLVTDNQFPNFLDHSRRGLDRIEVVDHKDIFQGIEDALPTFNTRAIATRVHHIPGLSEKYVVGNDDVMFSSPVSESFFFRSNRPVIYADWTSRNETRPQTLWEMGITNAAHWQGYNFSRHLRPSHGFIAFKKNIVARLEEIFSEQFENNYRYRFRHESQFLIESLFAHYCIRTNEGHLLEPEQMVHFSFQLCRYGEIDKIKYLFHLLQNGERKMFCINEIHSLEKRFASLPLLLESLCGPALTCETASF